MNLRRHSRPRTALAQLRKAERRSRVLFGVSLSLTIYVVILTAIYIVPLLRLLRSGTAFDTSASGVALAYGIGTNVVGVSLVASSWLDFQAQRLYVRWLRLLRALPVALKQGAQALGASASQPKSLSDEELADLPPVIGGLTNPFVHIGRSRLFSYLGGLVCVLGLAVAFWLGLKSGIFAQVFSGLALTILRVAVVASVLSVLAYVGRGMFGAIWSMLPVSFAADELWLLRWWTLPGGGRRRLPLVSWVALRARYLLVAAGGVLALALLSGLATHELMLSLAIGVAAIMGFGIVLRLLDAEQPQPLVSATAADEATPTSPQPLPWPAPHVLAVSWSDVRLFCIAANWRDLFGIQHAVVGVYTGRAFSSWEISDRSTSAQLIAHAQLCRLIATRTGLPLLDLATPLSHPPAAPSKGERP